VINGRYFAFLCVRRGWRIIWPAHPRACLLFATIRRCAVVREGLATCVQKLAGPIAAYLPHADVCWQDEDGASSSA